MAKRRIKSIKRKKRGQAPKKSIIKKILLFSALVFLILFAVFYFSLPDIGSYTYREPTSAEIYSSDGVLIGEISSRNITYIDREDIPDKLIYAIVAIEDKRYFKHPGVDIISIIRAMYHNILAGEIVEGGSTITQQVAKILFFDTQQTYMRKLKEAFTALRLTAKYSKDDIITIYLNEIYFGGGAFGVYEASETYFSKEPKDLTLAECATLAGIIQAPSAYCPLDEDGYNYAMQRKDKVLDAMAEQGYISNEEAEEAKLETIVINPTYSSSFDYGTGTSGMRAYLNRVYQEAEELIANYYVKTFKYSYQQAMEEAESLLYSEQLIIKSTLNYAMQTKALAAIDEHIINGASCALVSINSDDGSVVCYYGADNDTYLDMANMPRQPGSNIKPLYMLYLVEAGLANRNTVVLDERFNIGDYSPGNYSGKYMGYVTMREALTHSLNSACLQFFLMSDYRSEIDFIKSLGITTITEEDYNYAFALGGMYKGIKPIEMATAYSVINNSGLLIKPKFIISIQDSSGMLIFSEDSEAQKVVSESTANEIKTCLESVVLRGTATAANSYYATMGKTGTTDNSRDVWFTGATGNIVTSIWAGDIDYNSVEDLSSSWCIRVYRDTIIASVKDGTFAGSNIASSPAENTIEITVLVNLKADVHDIKEEDIAVIEIPDYEYANFSETEVVRAAIDSSTGLLYSERCPDNLRIEKYFLASQAPTMYCTSRHRGNSNNNNNNNNGNDFNWDDIFDLFRP